MKDPGRTPKDPGGGSRLRRPLSPPGLILVPALAVALAMLLPLFYLAVRAWEAGDAVVELLLRERTLGVLLNSAGLAAAVAAGAVALGLPLAWLTLRTDLPGRGLWTVLGVVPLAIPSLVAAVSFVAALGPGGLVSQLLGGLPGIPPLPAIYGFRGAWFLLTLLTFPYVLLSARAALQGIDPGQEEAARSLGYGSWQIFWRVIFPQLRPAVASGGLLAALYTLSDFAAVSLLQFESFTQAIYVQYQATFNRTYAAVLSLVLVLLTAFLLALEARVRGRGRQGRAGVGSGRRPTLVPLGAWRWAALAFCAAVVTLATVMPVGVNLYWLLRGVLLQGDLMWRWDALANSLFVSGLAAAGTALGALPVAVLSVRYPGPLSSLLERAATVGYALPGIVVALALVFFGVRYALPLYQTVPMLLFAYAVLFLPQALGPLRNSLLQVNPNVEQAARSLGLPLWRVVCSVTLPLVRPGLAGGAALVFLTAMKELPATLLLSPAGFRTLATQIWGAASEAYYVQAAVPSLVLIAASLASVGLLLRAQGPAR